MEKKSWLDQLDDSAPLWEEDGEELFADWEASDPEEGLKALFADDETEYASLEEDDTEDWLSDEAADAAAGLTDIDVDREDEEFIDEDEDVFDIEDIGIEDIDEEDIGEEDMDEGVLFEEDDFLFKQTRPAEPGEWNPPADAGKDTDGSRSHRDRAAEDGKEEAALSAAAKETEPTAGESLEPESQLTLEELMDRLESIIASMEEHEVGLEESFRLYQKGMKYLSEASRRLQEVEKKVQVLEASGTLRILDETGF